MFLSKSAAIALVIFLVLLAAVVVRRPKGKRLSLHHKTTLGVFLLTETASRVVENSNEAATIGPMDGNADGIFTLSIESG